MQNKSRWRRIFSIFLRSLPLLFPNNYVFRGAKIITSFSPELLETYSAVPSFIWHPTKKKRKTDVINDPLGQTHSLASSEYCFRLKFVLFRKVVTDARKDDICKNNYHYQPWLWVGREDQLRISDMSFLPQPSIYPRSTPMNIRNSKHGKTHKIFNSDRFVGKVMKD